MDTRTAPRALAAALTVAGLMALPHSARANDLEGDRVARAARNFVGTAYVWGGASPNGFDCSGLVQYVFRRQAGVSVPHSAAALYQLGQPVALGALRPGDLIFQSNTYKAGVSHVGIYVGGGKMVHAQNARTGVIVSGVPAHCTGARRILAPGSAELSWGVPRAVAASGSRVQLEGTVEAVWLYEGIARMRVSRVVQADGRMTVLSPARIKVLVLSGRSMGTSGLVAGATVAAIGTDAGPGTPLKVERIGGGIAAPSAPQPGLVPDTTSIPEEPLTRPAASATAPTRVLADFERGWSGWTLTGNAFGRQPEDALYGNGRFSGWSGGFYLSTAHAPFAGATLDTGRGRAVSPAFAITADRIRFRIAGGNHEGECCLNLVVDGQIVRTATGDNSDNLKRMSWDVAEFRGREAHLELVDERSVGLRGYILIDRVELCDAE